MSCTPSARRGTPGQNSRVRRRRGVPRRRTRRRRRARDPDHRCALPALCPKTLPAAGPAGALLQPPRTRRFLAPAGRLFRRHRGGRPGNGAPRDRRPATSWPTAMAGSWPSRPPGAADPQDGDLRRRREPLREPHPALAARTGKVRGCRRNSTTPGRIWCKAWRRPGPVSMLPAGRTAHAQHPLGPDQARRRNAATAAHGRRRDARRTGCRRRTRGFCRHHHPHPHAQRRLEPRLLRRHEPPACRRRPRGRASPWSPGSSTKAPSGREAGWPSARPGSSTADPGLRPRRPSAWPAALQPRACRPGGGAVGPAAEGCDATDR